MFQDFLFFASTDIFCILPFNAGREKEIQNEYRILR